MHKIGFFSLKSLAVLFAFCLPWAHPSDARADDFWRHLERPGVHAIMRHALAPGTGDPLGFSVGDCTTQRNLDARGRAQAGAIGAAFRDNGISFDRVLTSQWCRCRETAERLGLGAPTDMPVLNSFFADRSTSAEQTRDLLALLRSVPDGERLMLVTHQVNITALTGRAVGSGEVFLITVDSGGGVVVLDRMRMGL